MDETDSPGRPAPRSRPRLRSGGLDDEQKRLVREMPADEIDTLSLGLGTAIRNVFGLREGNEALLTDCGSPDMHPDSASMTILRSLWERLQDGC